MTLTADTLVHKSLQLVSAPTTYSEINELLNDPNSSAEDISAIINLDPALTARLLKIVNSPFYGFPSQINTISRAITIIGTRELMHLVLATSVIDAFKGIPADLIDMNAFWRHSLATAMHARYLADQCGHHNSERFFISGLLHNIGSLVIYISIPELAREAINGTLFNNETICEAEQRVIGFDHTETGAALIEAWRLPESLREVVHYHHTPASAVAYPSEVAIVHIADIMAERLIANNEDTALIDLFAPQAWALVELEQEALSSVSQQVAEQIDEVTAIMTAP